MYKIQANPTGTRFIEVSDEHLQTIEHYQLLRNLIDSNGIIDEGVLDKLKFNIRSLLESPADTTEASPTGESAERLQKKALLDLCLDVIYNSKMKAFGLHQLTLLYIEWKSKQPADNE